MVAMRLLALVLLLPSMSSATEFPQDQKSATFDQSSLPAASLKSLEYPPAAAPARKLAPAPSPKRMPTTRRPTTRRPTGKLPTSYPTAKPTAEPTYAPGSSVCDFGPDYTLSSMTMTLCMPGYIITDVTLSYGTCVYGVSSMVCSRLDGSSKDSPITAVINAGAVGGTQATVTSSTGFNGASSGWVREGAADAASQLYFTSDAFATSTNTFGYSGSPGAQFICPGAQKLVGLRHIPVKLDSNPGSAIGGIGVVCG